MDFNPLVGFKATAGSVVLAICVLLSPSFVYAQTEAVVTPGQELHQTSPKKGWFWYREPVKPKEEEQPETIFVPVEPLIPELPPAPVVIVPKAPKEPSLADFLNEPSEKDRLCTQKETWVSACGFIDPGEDFDFQALQRDELFKMMSLRPDNPDAVEAAQRYMKWVVGRASMAANMWYFNLIQKPDLDPRVKNPISEIGLALASRVESASSNEYFRLIREEGGILFYITRNDCIYCHDQAQSTRRVARSMGLELVNVPIDGICLDGFEGETCGNNVTPEEIAILDVQIVPSLYLYVPSSTWIRLGTGVVPDQTIMANTVNFFSAYRAAMLNGLDNSSGARPSVTFDPEYRPRATGTASADGSQVKGLPDQGKMMELLGFETKD